MSDPTFLSLAEVENLHKESIEQFGGAHGVRDQGLVESALASAENIYHYADGDLFEIAAAYAFHISESQAFLDGNKRTAMAAMMTFLKGNGVDTTIYDPLVTYDLIMALANRGIDKPGLAKALRDMSDARVT